MSLCNIHQFSKSLHQTTSMIAAPQTLHKNHLWRILWPYPHPKTCSFQHLSFQLLLIHCWWKKSVSWDWDRSKNKQWKIPHRWARCHSLASTVFCSLLRCMASCDRVDSFECMQVTLKLHALVTSQSKRWALSSNVNSRHVSPPKNLQKVQRRWILQCHAMPFPKVIDLQYLQGGAVGCFP